MGWNRKKGRINKDFEKGGGGQTGSRSGSFKRGEAGTPLQTMIYYLAVVFLALVPNLYLNKKTK